MKSYKKIMPIILIFALLGSVAYSYKNRSESRQKFEDELAQARLYSEMGIVTDSLDHYMRALDLEPSLQLYLEVGEIFLTNQDWISAASWYKETMLPKYPKEAETYLYGMRTNAMWEDYKQLFSIYEDYQDRGLHADKVEDFIKDYWYTYLLSGIYEDGGVFGASSGLAPAKYGGRWGYVDKGGSRKISYSFDSVGNFGDYAPAVTGDGRAVYIDTSGNEKINENFILEKDPGFGSVKQFRNTYSNLILASNGTEWNYYSIDTFEKKFGGYADALPVYNGVGAVSRDGVTWALISDDGSLLTDFIYDEVLTDKKEIAYRGGVLLVKLNGAYILINSQGQQIGSNRYTNAKPFYEATYAAVEKNGKWLFLDNAGEEHDLGDFEETDSFSSELAAVKKDGRWGFIDSNGEMVIENMFYDARPFGNQGACFVKSMPDEWQVLRLYRFQT